MVVLLTDSGASPFDEYKIVKNCNCKILCSNKNIHITNKHNAIVFYKKKNPVRLLVINRDTDVDRCAEIALNQFFEGGKLRELFQKHNIRCKTVDLRQKAVQNSADRNKEIDVGSCDRWALLYSMLKGSYTESESDYGNYQSDKYEFIPDIKIEYNLTTDCERFEIKHKCAFINDIGTRIIPIQENSPLTK